MLLSFDIKRNGQKCAISCVYQPLPAGNGIRGKAGINRQSAISGIFSGEYHDSGHDHAGQYGPILSCHTVKRVRSALAGSVTSCPHGTGGHDRFFQGPGEEKGNEFHTVRGFLFPCSLPKRESLGALHLRNAFPSVEKERYKTHGHADRQRRARGDPC